MIRDTDPTKPIFTDEEINLFWYIQNSTAQSSMLYSGVSFATLPTAPVSVLRVAALALDAMAAAPARMAVIKTLDIGLDGPKASEQLRRQAEQLRAIDDDSGAFAIVEQALTVWGFRDRFWHSVQRLNAPA